MEEIVKIDNMGRIEIPTALLDKLELKTKNKMVIEIDKGTIVLSKKISPLICLP